MLKKSLMIIVASLFLFVNLNSVSAATYYVSNSGDDSNNGLTESVPWRTIYKASTTMVAGDTVLIMGGTYYEENPGQPYYTDTTDGMNALGYPIRCGVLCSPNMNSGTPGNYITYKAHPNYARPIFLGNSSLSNLRAAVYLASKQWIIIDGVEISGGYRGVWTTGSFMITIKNCSIHDTVVYGQNNNGGVMMAYGGNSYNITVKGCEIYRNWEDDDFAGPNSPRATFNTYGVGAYSAKDSIVEENIIHDNGWGIRMKGDDTGIGPIRNNVFRRNIIYNSDWGIGGYALGSSDIYENVIYGCGDSGMLPSSDTGKDINLYGAKFFNNVVYGCDRGYSLYFYNGNGLMGNLSFLNNIGMNSNYQLFSPVNDVSTQLYDFAENYNLYYNSANDKVIQWKIGGTYNLWNITEWRANTLYGDNDVQANPLFVDAVNNNFRLQAGSPAIDNGTIVPGYHCNVSASIDPTQTGCKLWYGSAPDIGAYEYVSASSSPNFTIGFTDSLDKVYFEAPNDFNGTMTKNTQVYMAKNDYEATQLVIFPSANLQNVEVSVSNLQKIDGIETIPFSDIEINPVGYVNLIQSSRGRAGWQPDPLLPNQVLNLTNNVLQPYLITVYSLNTTKAGNYTGTITIKENGVVKDTATINVKIWNFEIPQKGKFKTTSFFQWGTLNAMWSGLTTNDRWNQMMKVSELGFKNRLPPVWGMASSFWSYGSSSGYGYPTHDSGVFNSTRTGILIDYMLNKGANHFFTAYTGDIYEDSNPSVITTRENQLRTYLTDYRNYLNFRGDNLLNISYVYGLDEPWGTQVDHAKQTYTFIKNNVANDIPFMQNTNQNNNAILETLRGFFDAIDINLGWYQVTNSDFYRTTYPSQFQDFWWNVNIWPDSPPNLFVDMELINARIMGPLSYRYNIQGFEYWQIFSTWSFSNYYSIPSNELRVNWNVNSANPSRSLDGLLVYPGVNRDVYSSLRYESFRDGIEDLESLYLLEARDSNNPLLSVPIVDRNNVTNFNKDPNAYKNWRIQIGEALDQLSTTQPPGCNGADVNSDNKVNILDLALAVFNQGNPSSVNSKLDIDSNGQINFNDVTQVRNNMWQNC